MKLIRGSFLFITILIAACNMPVNSGDSNDMAKWFDVGYDGSDTTNGLVSNNQESHENRNEELTLGAICS